MRRWRTAPTILPRRLLVGRAGRADRSRRWCRRTIAAALASRAAAGPAAAARRWSSRWPRAEACWCSTTASTCSTASRAVVDALRAQAPRRAPAGDQSQESLKCRRRARVSASVRWPCRRRTDADGVAGFGAVDAVRRARRARSMPSFRLASDNVAAVVDDLPPAGRHSAGDRTGRGARAAARRARPARAPGRRVQPAHRRARASRCGATRHCARRSSGATAC